VDLSNAAEHFHSISIKITDACSALVPGELSFITSAKAQCFLALAEIQNDSVH